MSPQSLPPDRRTPLQSVHTCPQCGFSINLKNIGLREGATGIVTCPKCEWTGPVEIQIVEKEPSG